MSAPSQPSRFDGFSILLHWSIAIFVIGLFASGLWMVGLGYYDDWYYQAPWWHKGIGVITALLIFMRWGWSLVRPKLSPITTMPKWQHFSAKFAHQLMNLAVLVLAVTGYFVVTSKGAGLSVFDWFTIPASVTGGASWVDLVGTIHLWTGYFIIALASLHALAAVKHHVIDKDDTLKRMIGIHSGDKK